MPERRAGRAQRQTLAARRRLLRLGSEQLSAVSCQPRVRARARQGSCGLPRPGQTGAIDDAADQGARGLSEEPMAPSRRRLTSPWRPLDWAQPELVDGAQAALTGVSGVAPEAAGLVSCWAAYRWCVQTRS